MSGRNWLLTLIFAVPVGAFIAWWLYTFERVPVQINLPPRGEARYNPLYALKMSLQARDIEVASGGATGLDIAALAEGDLLVLSSDVRLLAEDEVDELLEWVADGGHLVFGLPPGEDERSHPLLEALGIEVVTHFSCLEFQLPAAAAAKGRSKPEAKTASHCFRSRFRHDEDTEDELLWRWGNARDGDLMARGAYGDGSWFVASELDFLENDTLDEPGIAALAWQVLAPALGHGKVHLIHATSAPPLHVLLVREGWPILVPVLLALFAWLWARSQRFGALLPLAAPDRRALLEHIQATGEFAFRRGRGPALHAAVQRMFLARLRRRDPQLAALDGEALVQALSERCQYAVAAVRQALHPVDLARPDQFLATIKTLMHLRAKT